MTRKIFKSIGIVCGAGIFAAALLFSAQTLGYMDWQIRTTPGNPASGFMRTWANSSNNFGCLTSAGATCTVDPAATTSALGVVKTDGSTISNSAGLISCTTSTTSQLGCVKPDGTTITISGGVISSAGGGGGITHQAVVTGSRALGTVYHNTGATAMIVSVTMQFSTTNQTIQYLTDSSNPPTTLVDQLYTGTSGIGGGANIPITFVVLPGNYYKVAQTFGSGGSIGIWTEWN